MKGYSYRTQNPLYFFCPRSCIPVCNLIKQQEEASYVCCVGIAHTFEFPYFMLQELQRLRHASQYEELGPVPT